MAELTKNLRGLEKAQNTLAREVKANPKDRIEVEIGDTKQPDFKPQFKLKRWDNEVNFSIRAEEDPTATTDVEGEVVKYKATGYEVHLYEKSDVAEDGGFEFEWVLPAKPKSNVLTATIETKGLNFYYQPPLTEQEIEEGFQRPENVIGSYAVYHATKGGANRADDMEYKVGKAFHIYRPKAIDAGGAESWCELDITGANLTVTVPQDFLDSATYPVHVDPTFGYTSAGASKTYIAGHTSDSTQRVGSVFTGAAGTLDSISINVEAFTATETVTTAVLINTYDDPSDGTHAELVRLEGDKVYTTTPAWFTFTANSESVSADSYIVSAIGDGADLTTASNLIYLKYDQTAPFLSEGSNNTDPYATLSNEDPWVPAYTGNNTYSIYATYTASGGATRRIFNIS